MKHYLISIYFNLGSVLSPFLDFDQWSLVCFSVSVFPIRDHESDVHHVHVINCKLFCMIL